MPSRPHLVYCALHDPSDVDCQRKNQTWVIRVARARQNDGRGVMEDREPHSRAFQPASYRLVHAHAGRKIVAFSAHEAYTALRMLANSGLNVPRHALEQLQHEADMADGEAVKTAATG